MELAGNINDFSVIEISQFIWISKKTGKLMIFLEKFDKHFDASVFFDNGVIRSAFIDNIKGKDAFFDICEAENGNFHFIGGDKCYETNVMLSMEQLLLEASSRIKLYEILRREIPSSNIVYSISPEFETFELILDSKQWVVIGYVDGVHSINEISKEIGIPEFELMRTFYSLLQVGVLKRVSVKIKSENLMNDKKNHSQKTNIILKIIAFLKKL